MSAQLRPSIHQINLYNVSLFPAREVFTARRISVGVVAAVLVMTAIGWWALAEKQRLSQEIASKAAARAAETARAELISAAGGAPLTPPQLAALETTLNAQRATLTARRDARDLLRQGLATDQAGPSALMRLLATSAPTQAWLTDIRVGGSQLEVAGKTIDPAAVNAWLERLAASGYLSAKPMPSLRLDRVEAPAPPPGRAYPVYGFTIVGTLVSPLADEGGRP